MTDFLDILDGPKRPEVKFDPRPPGRDVSKYGAAALAGEVANIQAVPIGSGRNDQLNRSAVKMGGLIAAGAIDEHTVIEHLGAADGGLDYPATRATIASGLKFGMSQARAIPDRSTPSSTLSTFDSMDSGDPFSDAYAAPSVVTSSTAIPTTATGTPETTSLGDRVREALPIVDWFKAWEGPSEVEWIIEPLLPARRLVAIYSAPKVGKSLILLECAYHISRGTKVLGVTPSRAYSVLYVDFENDLHGDIVPRLAAFGADPTQLDRLYYLSLPTLAGLDSEKGATELMAAVQVYGAEVVIIDTVSRSVDGEENENDTWLKFYRQTGLRLKQAGVAMVRLDHTGKDETKGQRGGSAKGGDVDAVWKLSKIAEDHFRLECDMNRFPIAPADKLLTLIRKEDPLRHVLDMTGDSLIELAVKACDDAGLPNDAGRVPCQKAANEAGIKIGEPRAKRVVAVRKARNSPGTTSQAHEFSRDP